MIDSSRESLMISLFMNPINQAIYLIFTFDMTVERIEPSSGIELVLVGGSIGVVAVVIG